MPDPVGWLVGALAGGVLAALHLGGLWATVRRLPTSRHRVLLTAASLLVRVTLVAAGFVLVLGGDRDPLRLLAALAGFVVVRTVLVWRVRRGARSPSQVATSAGSGAPGASAADAAGSWQPGSSRPSRPASDPSEVQP